MAYDIERVDEASTWRCSAVTKQGQCRNKATTDGGTCPVHGGNKRLESMEAESIRNYQLAKFQVELNRHADSPRLKSLNDEVAILRMTLENHLNQCQDATDLIMKSHLISDLVIKIEKLVKSCHTLETSLGGVMDKQAILNFASKVIDVISANISDEAILSSISDGILNLVGNIGEEKSTNDLS